MATSQNVEDLSDAVTCSISLEEMKKRTPKSLPCQHIFCSQCIDKVLDNATTDKRVKTIVCPRCKVCQQSDSECEITRYCFKCALPMCQLCFKKHDDQFSSHKSVTVTGSTIIYLMCKEHEKPFEVYCADCCQILCKPCTIKEHSRHQIFDIKSNNKEDREAIDKAFTKKEKSANEELTKIDDMQRQFNEKMDTVESNLNKHLATCITQMNEQHEALKLKLEERRKEYNENLNNAKAIVQNTKRYVAMMRGQYKILRNPTTEISEGNICSTGVNVLAVEECIRNIKPLDFLPGPDKMLFGDLFEVENENAEQPEPLKMLYNINKLTNINKIDYLYNGMLVIADYKEGLQVYDPSGRPVQMTFTGKFKEHITFISADKSKPLLVVSLCDGVQVFTVDGDNWQEKTLFSDPKKQFLVALSVSGGIILMEYDITRYSFQKQSWSIMKYDINGKQLWSKQLQQWAYDICVDNQDRIIICHKYSVTVYDQSVNELFSIPTLHKAIIPFGVCVDSQDNIILVDSNNKAVLLYNSRGENRRKLLAESKPVLRVASNKDKCIAIAGDQIVTVFESC